MQSSQQTINKGLERELKTMLWGILAELKTPEEIKMVFESLMTEAEINAVVKRVGIAVYLDKGRSYEDIKNNIKVSSATIASVAQGMGNPGWQEVIRRIKAEQWAEDWTARITKGIRKFIPL